MRWSGTVVLATKGPTMEMDSTPAPTLTSAAPPRTCCDAETMAWRPEEQKRLIVAPDVDGGHPAQRAAQRATLWPVTPIGFAQPAKTSSTAAGSTPARCIACWIVCPRIATPCVLLNPPRNDLARPVRAVEAMTTWRDMAREGARAASKKA